MYFQKKKTSTNNYLFKLGLKIETNYPSLIILYLHLLKFILCIHLKYENYPKSFIIETSKSNTLYYVSYIYI